MVAGVCRRRRDTLLGSSPGRDDALPEGFLPRLVRCPALTQQLLQVGVAERALAVVVGVEASRRRTRSRRACVAWTVALPGRRGQEPLC